MADRLLFNQNFGDLEWTGSTQKKAVLPISSLVIPEPLLDAENYYFELDDVIYQCTAVSDTSSYLTFRYDVDGTNVLYVRLDKAQNNINISIRPASFPDVNFETSVLKLFEKESSHDDLIHSLVRFNRWKHAEITYNKTNNSITCELITDSEMPSEEKKYIKNVIVRFTKEKALEIKYDEINDTIEYQEV